MMDKFTPLKGGQIRYGKGILYFVVACDDTFFPVWLTRSKDKGMRAWSTRTDMICKSYPVENMAKDPIICDLHPVLYELEDNIMRKIAKGEINVETT